MLFLLVTMNLYSTVQLKAVLSKSGLSILGCPKRVGMLIAMRALMGDRLSKKSLNKLSPSPRTI